MKSFSKALALLLVVLMMSTALIGCSNEELSVFNAMIKAQSIYSMEAKTDLTLKLDISGLPEKDMQQAGAVIQLLNNAQLSLDQKVVQNKDKSSVKSQIDGKINLGGLAMDMGVWVDADFAADNPVIKEIIKLPPFAMLTLPPEFAGKEYIVMDASSSLDTGLDMKNLIKMSTELQTKSMDFLNSYAKQFKPGFDVIKPAGSKTIEGKVLPVYQLKLDDAALKSLIKYTVNNFAEDKETFKLVKDFVISLFQAVEIADSESAVPLKDIEKAFSDIEAGLPQFTKDFNSSMDALKDVKIIGDNGITINYAINDQGYIVNESGVIDLIIDFKALAAAAGQPLREGEPAPVIKLGLNFNTDTTRINENVEIKFPELTEKNSINFEDLISFPAIQDDTVKIYVDGEEVIFMDSPIIRNGRTLAPAREVFESLGGELLWNPETEQVTSVIDDNVIIFTIGSSKASINGVEKTLDEPAALINNRAYVPVRFLAESVSGEVFWDEYTLTAYIER